MPGLNTNTTVTFGYPTSNSIKDYVQIKKAEVVLNTLHGLCERGAIDPSYYKLKAGEVMKEFLGVVNVV